MRFSTKTLFLGVTIVALLVGVGSMANRELDRIYGAYEDFYAIDLTRVMLIDYLQENEGTWPSSWDDLRSYYDKYPGIGWAEDFEAHQQLIEIDFTFDPGVYLARQTRAAWSPQSDPKLVSLRSYRNDIDWHELNDVNCQVLAALNQRSDEPESAVEPESPVPE